MGQFEPAQFGRADSDDDSDEERERETELFTAINKGRLQDVKALLESGLKTDIINRNNKDNTPLHYAIEKGKKEIADELLLQHWKTDVDARNKNGDTPLHIASAKGRKEFVQLLLDNQANAGIKNLKGNTALELAKDQEIIDILSRAKSQTGVLPKQQEQKEKRKKSDDDDAQLKRLKIIQGTKRPIDEESDADDGPAKKLRIKPGEYHASGLKTSLHGTAYQLKLLMLFMKRGLDLGYNFLLATEMDAAGKMDDLVFRYEKGGKKVFRFLQAKHKQNEAKMISVTDLLTETDGEYSLQKYFGTFRSIKNDPMFNGINDEIRDLIMCTNIDYNYEDKQGDLELKNVFEKVRDEKGDEKIDDIFKTVLIKFKDDFNGKELIVSVLKKSTDLIKLAERFAEWVLDGKEIIDNDKSKTNASDNFVKSYQFALVNEVINIEKDNKIKIKDNFINGTNLSMETSNFRKAFEQVYDDRRKSYNFDNNRIRNEDLGSFAQEIATLMAKNKSSKPVKIERRKKVIKENVDKLAGHVLVIKKGEQQFSSAFLQNNKLPGNLDIFRNRFKIELQKQKIPIGTLDQYKFDIKDFKTCEEIYVDKSGFWKEIKEINLKKLFNDFSKSNDDPLASVDKFVNALALQIDESRNKDEAYIKIKRKDAISKNIDRLAGEVLIEDNDKLRFSSEFLNGAKLRDDLDEFRTKIRAKVADLDECRFEINNFPKLNLPNDSVADINNDINSYFDHLLFAVKQPSETDLDKIIADEIGRDKDINLIDSDFLANQFHKEMFNWMKEKEGRFLNHEDGIKFFDEVKRKLARLVLTCPSLEYRSKFEELNIYFNSPEKELQKFLDPNNKKQIFNLISSPDTVLGSIKVYQTLKSMPAYEQHDSYIFIRLNSLLQIQDRVADAFSSQSKHLLIIECKPLEETAQESYEELFGVITSNKKIVLITEKENTLSNIFKLGFSNKYIEKTIEVLDLTYESQNKILNDRKALFQGSEVVLGELINIESINLIDAGVLSSLINNKILEVAKPLQDLEDVKDYYRSRTFNHQVKINNHFQKDTSKFYITYDSQFYDQNLNANRDIIFISDKSDEDFKELCDARKTYNNHWLKKVNEEFMWQKSEGALSKLRDFIDKREKSIIAYKPEKITDITDKVVIIAAEPGMGKSTVLTNLAVKTKTSQPTLWVEKINLLVDCSEELKSLAEKRIEFNDVTTVEFLLKITRLDNELDRELFKNFYNRGNIVLLFDGFDEISPHYKKEVIKLLKWLKSTKVAKIWMTTRPYNIKDELEDVLSTFSYTLEEFSKYDQRIFLQQFWNTTLKFEDQLDDIRANIFIDKLLDKFTESINDREGKFISIPLQLKMIASVFQDTFYDFYNSDSEEFSEEQKRQFEKKLDMVGLYERFFDIKFDEILYGEKAPGMINADSKIRDLLDNERKNIRNNHKELALYSLYRTIHVENNLLLKKSDPDLLRNVKRSKDKVGIIDRVVNETPIFVHRTFAEYFAALWFSENWSKGEVKTFLKTRLIIEKSRMTRNFFDRILAKDDNEKYKIHNVVLNNDKVEVRIVINNNDEVYKTVDKAGRTPLHLAAAYGYEEIVQSLVEAASGSDETRRILSAKDDLFNWSALSYADKTGNWNIAELLLKNGANDDEMFQAISSIENDLKSQEKRKTLLHVAAENGYFEFAKFLIGKGADVRAVDINDKTPLHFAAEKGRLNLVEYFVDHKEVDVYTKDKYRKIPLHLAAEGGYLNIVRYFIDVKQVEVYATDKWGMASLHLAAHEGKLDVVKYFIEEKMTDITIEDEEDQIALHMAARNGHLETVEYLSKKGAELNTVNKIASHGGTPLHLAAQNGKLDVVEYLTRNGAQFDIVDDSTPLHWAALYGRLEVVNYFIEKENADIEAMEYDGSTLLHLAASNGHLEVVKYLVNEKMANLEAFDNSGGTPLHTAAKSGKIHVVEFLADKKSRTINLRNTKGETPSFLAVDGFLNVVRYLVDVKNADINVRNENGETPLHRAASSTNAFDVVRYLLEEKTVDFFAKDNEGMTALHSAARHGRSIVVNYFLERIKRNPGELGEILFDTEEYGMTPLHYAALNDQEEIVDTDFYDYKEVVNALLEFMKNYPENLKELIKDEGEGIDVANDENSSTVKSLLKKGAKLLLKNNHHTILHESVGSNKEEIVKSVADIIVREYGEHFINLSDSEGNTPLIWAARDNKTTVAEVLLKFNADVNAKNSEMKTALHLAVTNRHENMVEFLIANKADIEAEDKYNRRPLHWAAEEREWDIAALLVAEKANVNAADKDRRIPLHWAAADGNLSMVKIFTNNQADVLALDINGNTPLHLAAHGGELATVKYLAEDKRADFHTPNAWGNTPLHLAAQEGKLTTVNYLLRRLEEKPEKLNELLFDIQKYGMTPLHYAALNAREKVVNVLLNRMRNNEENLKALICVVEGGIKSYDNNSLVQLLLEKGAELFLKNKRYTILHEAIRGNEKRVIELIVERMKNDTGKSSSDLRINEPDNEGNTPLMWAVKRGKINAAQILIAHGAGLDVQNNDGQTALCFAAKAGYQDIMQLLIDKGANPGIED